MTDHETQVRSHLRLSYYITFTHATSSPEAYFDTYSLIYSHTSIIRTITSIASIPFSHPAPLRPRAQPDYSQDSRNYFVLLCHDIRYVRIRPLLFCNDSLFLFPRFASHPHLHRRRSSRINLYLAFSSNIASFSFSVVLSHSHSSPRNSSKAWSYHTKLKLDSEACILGLRLS